MNKKWSLTALGLAALAFSVCAVGVSAATPRSMEAAVGDSLEIDGQTFEEVYFTDFENTKTGTDYKGTVTSTEAQTGNIPWQVYYGNFSTNSTIAGSKSLQMRLYSDKKAGYAQTTADCSAAVKAFSFSYKVSNTAVRFDVKYSTDSGANWTLADSVVPASTTAAVYSCVLPQASDHFRMRVDVTDGFPSSSNYTFRIDDVRFAKAVGSETSAYATEVSIDSGNLAIDGEGKDYSTKLSASVTMSDGSQAKGVTWSSSNPNVAVIDEATGDLAPRGNGTAEITATTKDRGETGTYLSDTITVQVTNYVASKGEKELPFTVAEAIEAIGAAGDNLPISNAYTKGIVSKVETYYSKYSSLSYYISDDGATDNQLMIYSGKGLNNADFSSLNDLTVGQRVIVCGSLKDYQGTKQYDKNSYIAEFIQATPVALTAEFASGKGSYFNGSMKANNVLSTSHFLVKTFDDANFVQDNCTNGTGFILDLYKNGTLLTSLDASSAVQEYSFENAEPSSETVKYTAVAKIGDLSSAALAITVTAKDAVSVEWTAPKLRRITPTAIPSPLTEPRSSRLTILPLGVRKTIKNM